MKRQTLETQRDNMQKQAEALRLQINQLNEQMTMTAGAIQILDYLLKLDDLESTEGQTDGDEVEHGAAL